MAEFDRRALAAVLATALAIPAEGIRQYAYYDPPGILTACRGHTGPDVALNVRYSLKQCDQWMTDDMRKAVIQVDQCQPGLPVEVLAAFSDAVFNLGPNIACNTRESTAARMLKAGDVIGACNQLPRWDKAKIVGVLVSLPGLTIRRGKEKDLCLTGVSA